MFGLAYSVRVNPLRVAFSSRPSLFLTQLRTFVTKRVYVGGLPTDYTDDNIRELVSNYEIKNLRTPRFEGKNRGYCFLDVDAPIASDVVEYLKGVVVNNSVLTAEIAVANPTSRRVRAMRPYPPTPPPPIQPGYSCLYIGNLPWSADESRLSKLLEAVKDNVGSVRIPKDPFKRSKGYAFVEVKDEAIDDVILAIEGNVIDGRAIKVGRSSSQAKKDVDAASPDPSKNDVDAASPVPSEPEVNN